MLEQPVFILLPGLSIRKLHFSQTYNVFMPFSKVSSVLYMTSGLQFFPYLAGYAEYAQEIVVAVFPSLFPEESW